MLSSSYIRSYMDKLFYVFFAGVNKNKWTWQDFDTALLSSHQIWVNVNIGKCVKNHFLYIEFAALTWVTTFVFARFATIPPFM